MSVRDELRAVRVPGEDDAQRRALDVVRAAHAQRSPAPRSHMRLALAALAALIVGALAVTPPGAAVADWVRDVVKPGSPHAHPALARLPAKGRLLVESRAGAWVVQPDGERRLLAGYSGAAWSPHGLFVAAWHGRELTALEPGGKVHWVLPVPRPVDAARWSPDGFRIAYRLSGGGLYVVAGDGTGPRLLDQSWRTLAWRPGPGHVLAYARGTTVRIVDTDSRRLLGRLRTRAVPSALAWSADGQRLVASDGRTLSLADATGRTLRRVPFAGIRARSMAFAPRGSQLAAVRVLGGHSEVTVLDASTGRSRVLFAGVGTFSDLAWSPDGRWLLVGWHDADQWLFIPLRSGQRLTAVANVATQFGSPGAFPAVSGWAPSG